MSASFSNRLKRLRRRLHMAMTVDRYTLSPKITRMEKSLAGRFDPEAFEKALHLLERRLEASVHRRAFRKSRRHVLEYPPELPISAHREEIIDAVRNHPVVIVSGETGSGKTTQIPKFCLEAGRGVAGVIGCTQPRRIAAVTVAHRIAEEMKGPLGRTVGYKIRFQEHTGKDLFIKIMTDGILLAESARDRNLWAYDTLIIDEAHERSLNIDFLLGYLRNLLARRRNLKLIITSATIDTEKFSKAFHDAPVVDVSGRTYPVDIRYAPDSEEDTPYTEIAAEAARRLVRRGNPGDVLIFMPTERDIRETCEILEGMPLKKTKVMPLFSRLPAQDQKKIFAATKNRKIIVATNVAETSITIPGIRYVVDTGLARISQFRPSTRTNALPVLPISKSSADQRKGRCGRVEAGVCIRLYSETDYLSRPLYTPPEILRSNLAEVILKMIALDMGEPADFPFIDAPAPKWIHNGFETLTELGALKKDASGQRILTETGRKMARMPLDPRISRMLLEAENEKCLPEIAVIAAALSIPDPRETPMGKEAAAREAHRAFAHPDSDFLTLLRLWHGFQEATGGTKGASAMRRFCRRHYLSFRRMREWQDIHSQILDILAETGLFTQNYPEVAPGEAVFRKESDAYAQIHRAVLSGFLSNIALRKDKNIYTAARGKEVMLFPGSGLFNRGGEWIVAAEIVETSRIFARTAANIEKAWLEPVGKDQCRYTYQNPFWSKTQETVMAEEQVHLYGLCIEPGRPVPYGPIDPEKAGDVFIREALMEGRIKNPPAFLQHNQKLIREVEALEHKLRRRDLKAGNPEIYAFYSSRLEGVFDLRSLKKRIREKGSDVFLRMERKDLVNYFPNPETLSGFPDTLSFAGKAFGLRYRFHPGEPDDGVTLHVPYSLAPAIPTERLEWMVPGFLPDKIEALIKGLPKGYRKSIPPFSSFKDVLLQSLPPPEVPLTRFLSRFIQEQFGVNIPEALWSPRTLPEHLRMRIVFETPDGKCIHSGRAPDAFAFNPKTRQRFSPPEDVKALQSRWEKEGITEWNFEDLPETLSVKSRDEQEWLFFPALERNSVNNGARLRLFSFLADARKAHPDGVSALFEKRFARSLKELHRAMTPSKIPTRAAARFGGIEGIREGILKRVASDLFKKSIRTRKEFESMQEAVLPKIHSRGLMLFNAATAVFEALDAAEIKIHALARAHPGNPGILAFLESLRKDLTALVPDTFIQIYDDDRLLHLPRYIRATGIRAEKGILDFKKDQERFKQLSGFLAELERMIQALTPFSSGEKRKAVEDFYWLIEEFKVSLFAQELKTPFPVSAKKLQARMEAIQQMN
ncbi:MAG: ATP-dependent RNA helicase HrpA [Deltaproteobacteria bacterium]|nr:ATP-dependent RNA helicase HrpA [Deltaproteobacteria bacterium]